MDGPPPRAKRRALLFGLVGATGATLFAVALVAQMAWVLGVRRVDEELAALRTQRFEDDDALHVVFAGDSFTAGSMSSSGLGYWTHVASTLSARIGRPVQARSLALAGSTSPQIPR